MLAQGFVLIIPIGHIFSHFTEDICGSLPGTFSWNEVQFVRSLYNISEDFAL